MAGDDCGAPPTNRSVFNVSVRMRGKPGLRVIANSTQRGDLPSAKRGLGRTGGARKKVKIRSTDTFRRLAKDTAFALTIGVAAEGSGYPHVTHMERRPAPGRSGNEPANSSCSRNAVGWVLVPGHPVDGGACRRRSRSGEDGRCQAGRQQR